MVLIITRLIVLQFFSLIGFVFTWSSISSGQPTIAASENSESVTITPITPALPTATTTVRPSPTETEVPQRVSDRCIVVIDGNRYDVTDFRNVHSGGNIFQCGTDMSTIFWGRHNQGYLNTMAKYRI